ncbi:S8 family serine peptidase [Sphaerisporangium sp. TRM90804]|uniref:S8 family peptidase n=1 Tax=Sphaerisporangium sp. TRM90804 TaxID=3031113 RepID=UPI0024476689|nr:S8 family serine peptidase [Sphaerisporangium sp. TRM90804]MDH2429825.1 S8 family serine peptidase [Sphaerisporangium sp. TRM90804]
MLTTRTMRRLGALAAALAVAGVAAGPVAAEDVRDRQQWVLDAVNAEEAWKVTRGAGVTVAVIDSAVDAGVPVLKDRVTIGPDMRAGAIEGVAAPTGAHGTAMASLIAGSGRDGGLIGIAPEARVLSVPVLSEDDEEGENLVPPDDGMGMPGDSPLAKALRYATDNGAKVISMSLGEYAAERADRQAVTYALSRGVVLVAAVGNDGDSRAAQRLGTSFWSFPAGYSGVIGVGAVDRAGKIAPFSSDNLSVLVAAPGVGVPAATPEGYGLLEGSSASTALVAGAAALIKAKYPELRPELVARALASTTRGKPVARYDDKVGFGVVDAAAALAGAGRLTAYRSAVPVKDGLRFGKGATAPPAAPPGPDPVKLWIYGAGLVLGLAGFGTGVVVLTRRSERR